MSRFIQRFSDPRRALRQLPIATLVLSAAILVMAQSSCVADFMYGLDWPGGGNPSELCVVDPTTGSIQSSVSITGPGGDALQGLTADAAGTLYTFDYNAQQLFRVDAATGNGTAVGSFGTQFNTDIEGLDFNPVDGVLYGAATNNNIYTLNPTTGAGTVLTSVSFASPEALYGLAINSQGEAYVIADNFNTEDVDLFSLDLVSGSISFIGDLGRGVSGLAFDTHDTLWTIRQTGVYQIDTSTGAVSPQFYQSGAYYLNLTFTPSDVSATPEPASFTLLGLGSLGLIGITWRRRRGRVV